MIPDQFLNQNNVFPVATCKGNLQPSCTSSEWSVLTYLNYKFSPQDNLSWRAEYFNDITGQRTGFATCYFNYAMGWQHWFTPDHHDPSGSGLLQFSEDPGLLERHAEPRHDLLGRFDLALLIRAKPRETRRSGGMSWTCRRFLRLKRRHLSEREKGAPLLKLLKLSRRPLLSH